MESPSPVRLFALVLLATISMAACSGDSDGPAAPDPQGFTLSVSPASITLEPGSSEELLISITRRGGFAGSVSISAEGLPAGMTASTTSITGGTQSAVMTMTAGANTAPGETRLTIHGSSTVADVTGRSAPVSIVVTPGLDLDLDYESLNSEEREALTGLNNAERAALNLWRMQVLAVGGNNGGIYFNVLNNPQNFAESEVALVRGFYNEEMGNFGRINGTTLNQHFQDVARKITGWDIATDYVDAPVESTNGPVNLDNIPTGNNGLSRFNNSVIRLWTNDVLDNGAMDGSIMAFTLLSPFALDQVGDLLSLEDVKTLLAADLASGTQDTSPLRLAFGDVLDAIYFGGSGSSIAAVLSAAGIDQEAADALFTDWAARHGYNP